jgi:predicted RND superfamily exporter protein
MWEWLLERYARFALRRPWVLVAIGVALTAASVAVLPRLSIITSRTTGMVSEDHPMQARIVDFLREFGWYQNLIAYRFSVRILMALLPVTIGTLWTFGFASAAVGQLSLLTSVFAAVGLASLGLILVAGVSACILTAVVILPAILKLIIRHRAAKGVEENA